MKLVVPLVLFSAQDLQAFSGPKGKFPGKWHGVKLSPWKRHQLMKLRASKFGRRPMGFKFYGGQNGSRSGMLLAYC